MASQTETLLLDAMRFATDQVANATGGASAVLTLIGQLLGLPELVQPPFDAALPPGQPPIKPSDVNAVDAGAKLNEITISGISWPGDVTAPQPPVLPGIPPAYADTLPDPVFQGTAPGQSRAVTEMLQAYAQAPGEIRAQIDSQARQWMAQYCPQYRQRLTAMEGLIQDTLQNGTLLASENALWSRALARMNHEQTANHRQVSNVAARRGVAVAACIAEASLNQADQDASDRTATALAEISGERNRLALSHLEFSLDLSTRLRSITIQAFLGYAGIVADAFRTAAGLAGSLGSVETGETEAEVSVFGADIAKYGVDAKLKLLDVSVYREMIVGYTTQLEAILGLFEMDVKRMEEAIEQGTATLEANIEQAMAQVDQDELRVDLWGHQERLKLAAQGASSGLGRLLLRKAEIPYAGKIDIAAMQRELKGRAYASAARDAEGYAGSLAHVAAAAMGMIHAMAIRSNESTV